MHAFNVLLGVGRDQDVLRLPFGPTYQCRREGTSQHPVFTQNSQGRKKRGAWLAGLRLGSPEQ